MSRSRVTKPCRVTDTHIPPQAPEAEAASIAWAAGLFEGEGSLVPRRGGKSVLLTLAMTDIDVVERFRDIVGAGVIYALPRKNGWKQTWRFDVRRADDVLRITALFRPHLGKRRAARADELIAQLERHLAVILAPRACKACGSTFIPKLGSNAARREFCDWRCSNRYHGQRRADRSARIADSQLRIGAA